MPDEFFTSLLAIAHVVTAGMVTLHVLLTHREVRSSISWIGLAWLSPFLGSIIYVAFGINRVARRAERLRRSIDEGPRGWRLTERKMLVGQPRGIKTLARGGDTLTGIPIVAGNRFVPLENGDAAYPAMLQAIGAAERSVALSSYIFDTDAEGQKFIDALIAAHKRGVAVRVLVDGIGGGYFRAGAVRRLQEAGVPAARFLHEWLPWKMPFINLRNHKKLIIVDGRIGFAGGMNISRRNVGGDRPPRVQDLQFRLEGPIVSHLMRAFAVDWEFTTEEALGGEPWWPKLGKVGDIALRGVMSGPDEYLGRIESLWSMAIEQAEKQVRILTPYFLPEDRMLDILLRAADRGVKVEIVVPDASNHPYIDWAMRGQLATIRLDSLICHLVPEPFDHSKLMSVDGKWCSFGSANWDTRSMRLNFELLVECYDAKATAEIDAMIDRKIVGARRLTSGALNARAIPAKLRDASIRLFLPYL